MKTLIKTTIFLLVIFLLVYFGANYALKKIASRIVTELKPKLEQKGIIIEHFNYSGIQLVSYNSCAIKDIELVFHLNRKIYGKESFNSQFNSKSITVRFADFNNPSFFFIFNDFYLFIEPDEKSVKKPFGILKNGYLKSRIPLYLKDPEKSASEILEEIKILFKENKTPLDLEIHVNVALNIDDKEARVGLYTERKNGITSLKFNEEDILSSSKKFDLDLTAEEAKLISNYPSMVPAMIKITRDAKRISEMEKEKDQAFPEDAFRHVYWSYNLTRELGPALAKEITDARETESKNTKQEHEMDFHNNEIGRKFAAENISVEEIKKRVLNSDEIIRNPAELTE